MSLFKNEVGRPSNETIKKRNIFKGICVVFGLIIIGLVVYILNDKGIITFNKHGQNKIDNDKVITTTNGQKEENEKDISDELVTISKIKGQNCYLELDELGNLNMKVRSFSQNGNEYIDVKVNGINEKIVKIAVFAFSNDASETFAAISESGNLYLAWFVDSETEINFEKQVINKKAVDLEVVTDSADELKGYYDRGYVIYENDSNKHEIITSFNDSTNKDEFSIK